MAHMPNIVTSKNKGAVDNFVEGASVRHSLVSQSHRNFLHLGKVSLQASVFPKRKHLHRLFFLFIH